MVDARRKVLREKYMDNPIVELETPFTDERERFTRSLMKKMESCVIITSRKGP